MAAGVERGGTLRILMMIRVGLIWAVGVGWSCAADERASVDVREQRQQFQLQELVPAKSGSWIFSPGTTPRIIWRDVDEVRRLAGDVSFTVRWFDATLNESAAPDQPGRWMAWIEGTAPNGTPLRRALTFYAFPPNIMQHSAPDLSIEFPGFPGPNTSVVWHEHQAEFTRTAAQLVTRAVIDSEQGAQLIAGIMEASPLGRPARYVESAAVVNADHQLALKMKLLGLQDRVRPLRPPRRLETPAATLQAGSLADAGVSPDARRQIEELCQAWADDTGEPFVTLVARRGVIITHRAYGHDSSGQPIDTDYRCWVASITKTVTALMFSQFADQQLISLDAPLSVVFPDYPSDDPHVPTFRQCLNHTSGINGHAEYGGMRNPHLENIILNGIDVNEPNVKYSYSGMGFELVAKAMEIVTGKSAVRIYHDHLFQPLDFGDVILGNASSDGEFTALELGKLAQWVANGGRYGDREFISAKTFGQLLPQPLTVTERGHMEDEGLGLHWVRHRRGGAAANSKREEDLLFGPRTLGHGSFSSCVFLVDPEQQLVITQVRRQSGPRHAEWSAKFFQTVSEVVRAGDGAVDGVR